MERFLKFFKYEHLADEELKAASKPFCEIARQVAATLPVNAESTVAMRHLLDAKDAAVRSIIEDRESKAQKALAEGFEKAASFAHGIQQKYGITVTEDQLKAEKSTIVQKGNIVGGDMAGNTITHHYGVDLSNNTPPRGLVGIDAAEADILADQADRAMQAKEAEWEKMNERAGRPAREGLDF